MYVLYQGLACRLLDEALWNVPAGIRGSSSGCSWNDDGAVQVAASQVDPAMNFVVAVFHAVSDAL